MSHRYQIVKLIRTGRTGGIYEAQDLSLNRKVAMRRFYSEENSKGIQIGEEEFLRMMRGLGRIEHPNLVSMFDAGINQHGAFIISQFLEGESLYDRLTEGKPLSEYEVFEMAGQLLDALQAAHHHKVIHGALSTRSIICSKKKSGAPHFHITDLGINTIAPMIKGASSTRPLLADPCIMAPEIFAGQDATERSDLYSVGHLCYLCLAGGHPFAGMDIEEMVECHQMGSIPRLSKYIQVSEKFEEWIHDLMQVIPQRRPSSAAVASAHLSHLPPPPSPKATTALLNRVPTSQQNVTQTSHPPNSSTDQHHTPLQEQISSLSKSSASKSNKALIFSTIAIALLTALTAGAVYFQREQITVETNIDSSSDPMLPKNEENDPERFIHDEIEIAATPLNDPRTQHQINKSPFPDRLLHDFDLSEGNIQNQTLILSKSRGAKLSLPPKFVDNTLVFEKSQHITVPSNEAQTIPKDNFSVECFCNIQSAQNWGGLVSCCEDNGKFERGFILGFRKKRFFFKVGRGSTAPFAAVHTKMNYDLNRSYHLVGTYDGEQVCLYVDGQLVGTSPYSGKMTFAEYHSPFVIGAYKDSDEFFPIHANLAFARVYETSLTQKEVSLLSQQGPKRDK